MTDTAEKIKRINDVGAFETLAIRVLREIDEDCRAIVHLGINEAGKTIPGPVDAFGRIPNSSPSKYVMAAFTTTSLTKLEKKWLDKGASSSSANPKRGRQVRKTKQKAVDLGDLIKASENATSIRAVDPDAHFVVYLCTNQRLDDGLMQKVFATAAGFGLEVRFLDQGTLRDFLDTKPEGQWLRHEHLGSALEQVSLSSLRAASQTSQKQYAAAGFLASDQVIVTEQALEALKALEDRSLSAHLLVGPSGVGKTVIAQQIQRYLLDAGRLIFWLPDDVVERALSLSEALELVLRSIHPALMVGAGAKALQMGAEGPPIVLIVDDINRLSAPMNALAKILRWARPEQITAGKPSPSRPTQIICPMWDSHMASVRTQAESQGWIRVQSMRRFLRSESLDFLRAGVPLGTELHETELGRFADALNDDPILLALFTDTMRRNPAMNPSEIAHDILKEWTNTILAEMSRKTARSATSYAWALERLAAEIIIRKTLYPMVTDLRSWFSLSDGTADLLLQLAESGHLCRIGSRHTSSVFEFRHDRVLGFFLSGALAAMLDSRHPVDPAVWDPFFTPFLGQAIGRSACPDTVLDDALARNPNALIAALPYLENGDPTYFAGIKDRIRTWLTSKPSVSPYIWLHGISLLRETTGSAVLEVTDGLSDGPVLLEARLRNGDILAGARVLASRFWPGSNSWMEEIIAHAIARHRPAMVSELGRLLRSPNLSDELRGGALVLAGYIGDGQIIPEIMASWKLSKDKKGVVLPGLWAALRCADSHPEESIGVIFPSMFDLDDDPTGRTYSRRHSALQQLGWSARHGFTKCALQYLLLLAQTETYRQVVIAILSEMPEAITVSFVLRQIAKWENEAQHVESFSPFAMSWPDYWQRWRKPGQNFKILHR
jgi:hypothetical protein